MIKDIDKYKIVIEYKLEDKKEIPCKDMDLDCLPDDNGLVPFGSYIKCYLYDSDMGNCPFLPI